MIERSHHFALLSEIAYLDEAEAKPKLAELGYKNHIFLEKDGAQCHVVWNRMEMVLCFRGTEPDEFSDIKADLNAFPDKAMNGHGLVHNGFQEEVNKIWRQVKANADTCENRDLYITGHSLGGAMATIAASRLKSRVTAVYTFGAPRVGTKSFVKSFTTPHYRFVNNNDIVPKVPFAFLGYRHHVPPTYINYYGNIRPSTYWQRLKDQWRGRVQAWKKGSAFDGAYDHSMKYYVRYTEKNYGNN